MRLSNVPDHIRPVMERLCEDAERRGYARGLMEGKAAGQAELIAGMKALQSVLPMHPVVSAPQVMPINLATPVPTEQATEGDDDFEIDVQDMVPASGGGSDAAAFKMLVMTAVQEALAARGEDPQPVLDYLSDLLDDPAELRKWMSGKGDAVDLAWKPARSRATKRNPSGNLMAVWDTDPTKRLYGTQAKKALDRQGQYGGQVDDEELGRARAEIGESDDVRKLAAGRKAEQIHAQLMAKEKFDASDSESLQSVLPTLSHKQLAELRKKLIKQLGGKGVGRSSVERMDKIKESIAQLTSGAMDAVANGMAALEDAAKPAQPQSPAAPPVETPANQPSPEPVAETPADEPAAAPDVPVEEAVPEPVAETPDEPEQQYTPGQLFDSGEPETGTDKLERVAIRAGLVGDTPLKRGSEKDRRKALFDLLNNNVDDNEELPADLPKSLHDFHAKYRTAQDDIAEADADLDNFGDELAQIQRYDVEEDGSMSPRTRRDIDRLNRDIADAKSRKAAASAVLGEPAEPTVAESQPQQPVAETPAPEQQTAQTQTETQPEPVRPIGQTAETPPAQAEQPPATPPAPEPVAPQAATTPAEPEPEAEPVTPPKPALDPEIEKKVKAAVDAKNADRRKTGMRPMIGADLKKFQDAVRAKLAKAAPPPKPAADTEKQAEMDQRAKVEGAKYVPNEGAFGTSKPVRPGTDEQVQAADGKWYWRDEVTERKAEDTDAANTEKRQEGLRYGNDNADVQAQQSLQNAIDAGDEIDAGTYAAIAQSTGASVARVKEMHEDLVSATAEDRIRDVMNGGKLSDADKATIASELKITPAKVAAALKRVREQDAFIALQDLKEQGEVSASALKKVAKDTGLTDAEVRKVLSQLDSSAQLAAPESSTTDAPPTPPAPKKGKAKGFVAATPEQNDAVVKSIDSLSPDERTKLVGDEKTPMPAVQKGVDDGSTSFTSPADVASVQDQITKIADAWFDKYKVGVPFSAMYTLLKQTHPSLSQSQFHDILRSGGGADSFRLSGWAKTLYDLPKSAEPLWVTDKPFYFVNSPKSGAGGSPSQEPPPVRKPGFAQSVDKALAGTQGGQFDQLYAQMRQSQPDLTIGEFHDAVKRAVADGKAELVKWGKSLYDLPKGDLAMMDYGSDGVVYGVKMNDAPPTTPSPKKGKAKGVAPKKDEAAGTPPTQAEQSNTPSGGVQFLGKGRGQVREFFGTDVQDDAMADIGMASGLPGQSVEVYAEPDAIQIVTTDGNGFGANRLIQKEEDGTLTMSNDSYHPSEVGGGKGTATFGKQLEAARKLGIGRITTYGSRNPGDNGYYTWPRLGYDGEIPKEAYDKIPAALKSAMGGSKNVSALMQTPEGREWWKANGVGMDLSFDTSPDSSSSKAYAAYTSSKSGVTPDQPAATLASASGGKPPPVPANTTTATPVTPTSPSTNSPATLPPTPSQKPTAAKYAPQFRHSNPSHPVAKSISGDHETTAVVGRFLATTSDRTASSPKKSVQEYESDSTGATRAMRQAADAIRQYETRPTSQQKPEERARLESAYALAQRRQTDAATALRRAKRNEMPPAEAREALLKEIGVPNPAKLDIRYDARPGIRSLMGLIRRMPDGSPAKKSVSDAAEFVSRVVGGDHASRVHVFRSVSGRAFYAPSSMISHPSICLSDADQDPQGAIHEMGHHLENTIPGLQELANQFRDYRLGDEKQVKLSTVPGGEAYGDQETGAKDNFDRVFPGMSAYYVGKSYGNSLDTEIISMGLEQMYSDPVSFAKNDPEYFHFLVGVLRRGGAA